MTDNDKTPHAVFSVEEVKPNERYDLWKDSISCIFEVDAKKDVRHNKNFSACIDANMFGSVMLATTSTAQQSWDRNPLTIAQDGMDHIMIQLYDSGNLYCERNGKTSQMPENGLMVFDLAQEVKCKTDNFSNMSLIIPRNMLNDSLKDIDDQHLRELTANEPMVQLLRDHMLSLKRLSSSMSLKQSVQISPATVSLAAACLNASESQTENSSFGVSVALLMNARRYIEANLTTSTLSSDEIAKAVHVSRSRLYNLFKPYNGIFSYIRERRLHLALKQLTDKKHQKYNIVDIAFNCGFTNSSYFTRAFKERFGMTPKDARFYGSCISFGGDQYEDHVDRRYEEWMKTMVAF